MSVLELISPVIWEIEIPSGEFNFDLTKVVIVHISVDLQADLPALRYAWMDLTEGMKKTPLLFSPTTRDPGEENRENPRKPIEARGRRELG